MKWYAWHVDDGIVGIYGSKTEAMQRQGVARCRRIEYGCYETIPMDKDVERLRTVTIGTRKNLQRMGVEDFELNPNYK